MRRTRVDSETFWSAERVRLHPQHTPYSRCEVMEFWFCSKQKKKKSELIQWVTPESRSSAASNSGLIRIGTQPQTTDAWHHDSCRPRGVVTRDFSAIFDRLLTVFPFEFRPRTFTIGFYGKKSFISELMILECSFPLTDSLTFFLFSSSENCLKNVATDFFYSSPANSGDETKSRYVVKRLFLYVSKYFGRLTFELWNSVATFCR